MRQARQRRGTRRVPAWSCRIRRCRADDDLSAGILARGAEDRVDDAIELGLPLHEVRRKVRGQERGSSGLTRTLQDGDETLPVLVEIVGLDLLHPARHL